MLGIETSCDETGVALLRWEPDAPGSGLLAHTLYSQIKLHAEYGGVVPELASRDHVRKLLPLIREALAEAGLTREGSGWGGLYRRAGTGRRAAGGRLGGRALAWALGVPAIGVHHMEGHLLAPLLEENPPEPPFVALLVSGGHSMLVAGEGDRRLHASWATRSMTPPARRSTRPPR